MRAVEGLIVIVADKRGFVRERFPFPTREAAGKYLTVVRSRGLRAWIEGEPEPVHVAESDKFP